MKSIPKQLPVERAALGMLIIADKEGDNHSIPVTQIRNLTDWKKEWGDNVSAVVMATKCDPFPNVLRVHLPLEELSRVFQKAAHGAVIDLRHLSGPAAYEKPDSPIDGSLRQKLRYLVGGKAKEPILALPAPEHVTQDSGNQDDAKAGQRVLTLATAQGLKLR